tara:strand:+ start:99 stop:629 length:531 start_codon:yes stop_codon:yes gene_type:complete
MAIKQILKLGNPNLRLKAKDYSSKLIGSTTFLQIVSDLRDSLHESGGIGLAAPQINIPFRILVIEITSTSTRYGEIQPIPFEVYVNPVASIIDDEKQGFWEGCLSVPGMMGYVERPRKIKVDYVSGDGERKSTIFEDFLATVFQHELDHLNGIIYVDKIADPGLFAFEDEYRRFHV